LMAASRSTPSITKAIIKKMAIPIVPSVSR
jgi:hypothetical protein